MESSNTLTSKGTVTIPKYARDQLGLKPGDKVHFAPAQNGTYNIQKELTLEEVQKMNEKYSRKGIKRMTRDEINEGMAKQAVERYKRSIQ